MKIIDNERIITRHKKISVCNNVLYIAVCGYFVIHMCPLLTRTNVTICL